MRLSKHPIVHGCFLSRENRFIARVRLEDGAEVRVHVPNTGRMKELLVPEAPVLLSYDAAPHRKTSHTLIAVQYQGIWVSVYAAQANALAAAWLQTQPGIEQVRREVTYDESRFDLACIKNGIQAYYEVKSVNLVIDGTAMFPDAPTTRGVKHLKTLIQAREAGFYAGVIFVVQREDAECFIPNAGTDPEFARWLKHCEQHGVETHVLRCRLTDETISVIKEIGFRC